MFDTLQGGRDPQSVLVLGIFMIVAGSVLVYTGLLIGTIVGAGLIILGTILLITAYRSPIERLKLLIFQPTRNEKYLIGAALAVIIGALILHFVWGSDVTFAIICGLIIIILIYTPIFRRHPAVQRYSQQQRERQEREINRTQSIRQRGEESVNRQPTLLSSKPIPTKGFSRVNPIEYREIPKDAIDPFIHTKIHDLISDGKIIMKCNECGVYYDKEVWKYFGKTCARIGCANNKMEKK